MHRIDGGDRAVLQGYEEERPGHGRGVTVSGARGSSRDDDSTDESREAADDRAGSETIEEWDFGDEDDRTEVGDSGKASKAFRSLLRHGVDSERERRRWNAAFRTRLFRSLGEAIEKDRAER